MKIRKFIQVTTNVMPDEAIVTTMLADDGTLWGGNNKNAFFYLGCAPQVNAPEFLALYESNQEDNNGK